MKCFKSIYRLVAVSAFVLFNGLLFSANSLAAGLLTPTNNQLPKLEIRKHDVSVIIQNGYAITTVEQVFSNPNRQDLEAVYSFPVPEKAAVSEFTVWIDGKPVTAEVLEKQQAKQVYEAEKAAGRDAGLMEKDEYRTFDIRVSPVRALQDTRIRFSYMQTAKVDTGIGRFVYPLEEGGVDEQKLAFWTAKETVKESFSFKLKLRSAYPVAAVRLPNQPQAQVRQLNDQEWLVDLSNSSNIQIGEEGVSQKQTNQPAFTLDQDLVVYWRQQQGLPGSVDLVSYKAEGSGRGTFMLTLTPGDDLQAINEGSDWVFVLDISGSMQGKYATLADGVQKAFKKMRVNDRFRVVLFNNNSRELTNGYVNATPEMIKYYSDALAQVKPGNGTNLYAGLQKGLANVDADRTSAIVLVTDGVANVGITKQKKFIELLQKQDIRLFTFIMGNSANRPMLQAMTDASNGFAVSVSNSDDIVGKILEASSKVTHQSLHGVKVDIDGVKTADISPKKFVSLYRGQQLVLFGHYWGDGQADIRLSGEISGQEKVYQTQIQFPAANALNPELERLWAYANILDRQQQINNFGEDADLKQSITDLSTEYGLVTDYTSMIVVRDEVFQTLRIKRNNKQRLAKELLAQQQRVKQAVVSNRVDSQQPMFQSARAGHSSGSGSFQWWLLCLLGLVSFLRRKYTQV